MPLTICSLTKVILINGKKGGNLTMAHVMMGKNQRFWYQSIRRLLKSLHLRRVGKTVGSTGNSNPGICCWDKCLKSPPFGKRNTHHVTCCSFTSFLGAVDKLLSFLIWKRGVLHKGYLFLSQNMKVQHGNTHKETLTRAQMEVMEQHLICALKESEHEAQTSH